MNKENWKMAFNHPTELGIGHIHNENGTDIATAFLADNEENKKSLEFMLMAANNHDALVSALEFMIERFECEENIFSQRLAISKANVILDRCKQ